MVFLKCEDPFGTATVQPDIAHFVNDGSKWYDLNPTEGYKLDDDTYSTMSLLCGTIDLKVTDSDGTEYIISNGELSWMT